jgi:ABC-type sugar transport system ATPase subunit
MTNVEPYHRNVAMAFESYALYPQQTVAQNLSSPLRSGRNGKYSAAQQQERVDAVTVTLGIDHLQQRFPRELSNGQRQRVALGRVLIRPADVYLLDEPLSHLDAKLRAAMRAELRELGRMSNTGSWCRWIRRRPSGAGRSTPSWPKRSASRRSISSMRP